MAAKPSLLDLPDPCLLAIISHCRSDARTLCNAALAHSSLHSAAAPAHTSISLRIMPGHMPSLLRFLTAHGQHVQHLHLSRDGSAVDLPALQLPPSVQLESLALSNLHVSLSLDSSDQHSLGVLDRQSRLQTLSWYNCSTDTSLDGIAAALKQLPALRDLAVTGVLVQATHHCAPEDTLLAFPGEALSGMGLTRLELSWEALAGDTTYVTSSKLPFISTLTALQDLCICPGLPFERDSLRSPYATVFTASMFAPLSRLTSLRLFCKDTKMNAKFEPQALRDKTSLQHLALPCIWFAVRGEGDVPAVFAELHQLQELTYLNLHGTFREKPDDAILPAAACTSLAASSKLQHLDISCNFFPLGLWQELFNPNRRLQQLRVLDIGETNVEYDNVDSNLLLTAADAQRLASCCPGLQQLSAYGTLRGADAVAALSPLSCSLRTLLLGRTGVPWAKLRSVPQMGWAQALAQLTSLEELDATIEVPWGKLECDMQYLTNLRCLTRLEIWNCSCNGLVLKHQDPPGRPVWQQVDSHFCIAFQSRGL